MDFTHLSSIENCMPLPNVMGVCRDIPLLITISSETSSNIAIWNGQSRNELQPLAVLSGHVTAVTHLCISRDSKWLFSVSEDSWLLWQLEYCFDKEFVHIPPQSLSKFNGGQSSCKTGLMISSFSPCNSHLFVSTIGGVCVINTRDGLCSEIDYQLLCPSGTWTILSAVYCNSSCVAITLEDRTFRIYNLETHTIVYQSSVFSVSFTSIDCTVNYLILGTYSDRSVKIFSLPGLFDRSCDAILHNINHLCDQQSCDQQSCDQSLCDQTDIEYNNVSVLGIHTFEDKVTEASGLITGVLLIVVIRRCGLTFINGFNRSIIGELTAGDCIPSLVHPQEPTFTIPNIYNASIVQTSHDELVCSVSGIFDGVISMVKISLTNNEPTQILSVTSSLPLVADSMLRTQLLTPQQLKVSQELKHDKMRSKTSLSIKDQPLTFKNKVKSSGYTQQPRRSMFTPSTNVKQKSAATGATVLKKTSSLGTAISSETCHYDNMYRSHSYVLPERQPIKHCLFTGDGSQLHYTVTKTLYTMKSLPSPLSRHLPLDGHDGDITGISGSHDNQWILTCSSDKTAKAWRVNPIIQQQPIMNIATTVHNYKQSSNTTPNRDNTEFPGAINHCSFYYLDKFILLSYSNKISLLKYHFDTEKSHDIKRYFTKSHYKRVSLISLDPALKSITSLSCINDFYSYLVYVAGSDRSLQVYDMNVMKWVWSVPDAHRRPINCIVQNKGSKFVARTPSMSHDLFVTSSISDGLKLWDTRTQRCVRWYNSHRNQSQPVSTSFSPCGQYIATGSEDKMVYLYDTRNLAPVEKLVCKTNVVSTVQYHPFRPTIACGTLEGELNFFETDASLNKN